MTPVFILDDRFGIGILLLKTSNKKIACIRKLIQIITIRSYYSNT